MNFVGYTYKADVEAEKSMLVNVLKELDSVSDQQFESNENQVTNDMGTEEEQYFHQQMQLEQQQ